QPEAPTPPAITEKPAAIKETAAAPAVKSKTRASNDPRDKPATATAEVISVAFKGPELSERIVPVPSRVAPTRATNDPRGASKITEAKVTVQTAPAEKDAD
ncbi:MAG: hypothetical protein HRU20_21760, partial [Pseudomonadales bacterium]|nr:hypothetical protein [Pseudomonadales bacterium]